MRTSASAISEKNTEEQILKAAETVFLEKGFDATSVADIAEKAGCNRALVYYYFRTKENLFEKVFVNKIGFLFENIDRVIKESSSLHELLEKFVDLYFSILTESPKMPLFVITELIMNKQNQAWFVRNYLVNPKFDSIYTGYGRLLQEAIERGEVREIKPLHLFLNVLSLISFTYISLEMAPVLEFGEDDMKKFVEERREEIVKVVWSGIKK